MQGPSMARLYLTCFCFFGFIFISTGQEINPLQLNDIVDDFGKNWGQSIEFDHTTSSVKGSPFLLDEFILGEFVLSSSGKSLKAKINYDALKDSFIVINRDQKISPNPGLVSSFSFKNSENGRVRNFVMMEGVFYGFLEVLYDGKEFKLYAKRKKYLEKARQSNVYNAGKKYDTFKMKSHYILSQDDSMFSINLKKSLLLDFISKDDLKTVSKALTSEEGFCEALDLIENKKDH